MLSPRLLLQVDDVRGVAGPPPSTSAEVASKTQPFHPDLSWGDTFHQLSITHFVTLGLCAALIWSVVYMGTRHRRAMNLARGVVDAPGQTLGAMLTVYCVIYQLWWSFPHRPIRDSWLPLQLCDLAGLVGGLALLTGSRWLTTTLYFWAFAFTTQAFITPIVREGPATARFWMFWESHTAIIGSAVYVVAVRGYRPAWNDVRLGILVSVLYVAVVLPLDIMFGWNYGYVGQSKAAAATIVDRLGPWPWRLLPMIGLGIGAILLVWMPWIVADKFGKRSRDTATNDDRAFQPSASERRP